MKNQVLFVDDEINFLNSLKRNFRDCEDDWQMTFLNSVEEAIEITSEKKFDVIVSDVKLPGKDGFDLLTKLKHEERSRHWPMLMITGLEDQNLKSHAIKNGATDLLTKPIKFNELKVRLEACLRDKRFIEKIIGTNQKLANENEKGVAILNKTKKKKENYNSLGEKILSNMSHEFRTPLNHIMGYSQILIRKAKNENIEDNIEKDLNAIYKAGQTLLNMVDDILELAKIENKDHELIVQNIPLKSLLEEIEECSDVMFGNSDNKFFIELITNIDVVQIDIIKLKKVLLALIDNANNFTQQGSVLLKISTRNIKNQFSLVFDVIDTGIGISEEQQKIIFKNFVQADMTNTRKYGGLGLGLALSRAYCNLMGGDVSIESNLGSGTKASVVIPIQGDGNEAKENKVDSNSYCSVLAIGIEKILEDSLILPLSLNKNLFFNCSLDDGEKKIKEIKPSLVFFDLGRGETERWKVLTELLTICAGLNIPMITFSRSGNGRIKISLSKGKSGIIKKPFEVEEFRKVILNHPAIKDSSNVLIIDDNPGIKELMKNILEKEKISVNTANNGKEGLESLARYTPDLIILDLEMPVMDGFQFLKAISLDSLLNDIPIIIVSAKELKKADCLNLESEIFSQFIEDLHDQEEIIDAVINLVPNNFKNLTNIRSK
jgi:signal transduction histidine kinase